MTIVLVRAPSPNPFLELSLRTEWADLYCFSPDLGFLKNWGGSGIIHSRADPNFSHNPNTHLCSGGTLSWWWEFRQGNLLTSNQEMYKVLTKCRLFCYVLQQLLLHLPPCGPENSVECTLHTKTVDMEYSFLLSKWHSPSLGMTMPASLLSIPKWESASLTKTSRWRESFRQPIFSYSEKETFGPYWMEVGNY